MAILCSTAKWACAEGVFPVTHFGAKGDGRTDDYGAVLNAAAAVKAAGGGTLLFPNLNGGTKTGYVTGAFNISSNTRVEIAEGVHLLGARNSSQWPLLTVAEVWPGFGYARDGDFGGESGRLMHQSLLFTWSTTNVSVGGGGTIDCRGDYFQACGNNLTKAPCSGHARPECVFFSNATDVVFEDVTVLNSPDWTLHFSSVGRLRVRRVNVTQPGTTTRGRMLQHFSCTAQSLTSDGMAVQVEATETASTLTAARTWWSKTVTLNQAMTPSASSQASTGSAAGKATVRRMCLDVCTKCAHLLSAKIVPTTGCRHRTQVSPAES